MQKTYKLGVIGGGFMARAIVEGALERRVLAPSELCIDEPDEAKRRSFAERGCFVTTDARALAEQCNYLLFAVKPQAFREVAACLRGARLPVLISIMAGKTVRSIQEELGTDTAVARVMPNLPCSVGEGMSAIDASMLSEKDRSFVLSLFSAVGKTAELPESLLDAVTGISGSGPAYVYLFLQSLAAAGVEQGLSEEQANALALQTLKGGVAMAERTKKPYGELIAAVSSKGGTTVAALSSFERDDFSGSVARAVQAAVVRAKELSQ